MAKRVRLHDNNETHAELVQRLEREALQRLREKPRTRTHAGERRRIQRLLAQHEASKTSEQTLYWTLFYMRMAEKQAARLPAKLDDLVLHIEQC